MHLFNYYRPVGFSYRDLEPSSISAELECLRCGDLHLPCNLTEEGLCNRCIEQLESQGMSDEEVEATSLGLAIADQELVESF